MVTKKYDHHEVRCEAMADSDCDNLLPGSPRTCCVCIGHNCKEALAAKGPLVTWPDLDLPPINLLSLGREDSPCKGVCELREGKCVGCLRSSEEIGEWTLYDRRERWAILARIHGEDPSLINGKEGK